MEERGQRKAKWRKEKQKIDKHREFRPKNAGDTNPAPQARLHVMPSIPRLLHIAAARTA
jgi:hypothetical protein